MMVDVLRASDDDQVRGLGQDVRDARRALGWSQTELANRAQVSRPTIARVETGENISTGTLEKIAKTLGKHLRIVDQT